MFFCPAVCSGFFVGIGSSDFSEFWHAARNPFEVVRDRTGVFGKNAFPSRVWEMGRKYGFLNLKRKLVIYFH